MTHLSLDVLLLQVLPDIRDQTDRTTQHDVTEGERDLHMFG